LIIQSLIIASQIIRGSKDLEPANGGTRAGTDYLYHELSAMEVEHLKEQLSHYPQIARAYLVRKEVRYFSEKPLYALGITLRKPWYRHFSKKDDIRYPVSPSQVCIGGDGIALLGEAAGWISPSSARG